MVEKIKKYHLLVLGCQMNKADSERIEAVLDDLGYQKTEIEQEADLIGVVACSVRQTAMDRIHGRIKVWNSRKKEKSLITFLTGCVLPTDKKNLAESFDLIFSIEDLVNLPKWLKKIDQDLSGVNLNEYEDYLKIVPHYDSSFRAFVPIMTGCDNFCTYCAVPYTRGREKSRLVQDVLNEIKKLAETGFKEIVLLGQNVNTYRPKDRESFSTSNFYQDAFAALLWEVNQISGLDRVHFTAPHPKDMSDEVVDALTLPKQINFIHLPLQSGSNKILAKMNRHYTAEDYWQLVEKIRQKKTTIALGTDLIVGFPGEAEDDFLATYEWYKKIEFDISYHAMYSPRVGTVSAKSFIDDVSKEEKRNRWQMIQKLMEDITYQKNKKYLDQIVEVLVEKKKKEYYYGNSREYKLVRFFSTEKNLIGKIIKVKINRTDTWLLEGECI